MQSATTETHPIARRYNLFRMKLEFLKTRVTRYSEREDRYGDPRLTITEEYCHPRGILGWLSRLFGAPETKTEIYSGYMD